MGGVLPKGSFLGVLTIAGDAVKLVARGEGVFLSPATGQQNQACPGPKVWT